MVVAGKPGPDDKEEEARGGICVIHEGFQEKVGDVQEDHKSDKEDQRLNCGDQKPVQEDHGFEKEKAEVPKGSVQDKIDEPEPDQETGKGLLTGRKAS